MLASSAVAAAILLCAANACEPTVIVGHRLCSESAGDAAVAPDRYFYAEVSWAAFKALSCPPSAHLEKKICVPNAVCAFMMSITP